MRTLLAEHDYLVDPGLATACFLALRLHRPLFLEGEPGVGKTEVGKTLAGVLGVPFIRLRRWSRSALTRSTPSSPCSRSGRC